MKTLPKLLVAMCFISCSGMANAQSEWTVGDIGPVRSKVIYYSSQPAYFCVALEDVAANAETKKQDPNCISAIANTEIYITKAAQKKSEIFFFVYIPNKQKAYWTDANFLRKADLMLYLRPGKNTL